MSPRSGRGLRVPLGVSAGAHLLGALLASLLWPATAPPLPADEAIVLLTEAPAEEAPVPTAEPPKPELEPTPEVKPEEADPEEIATLAPAVAMPAEVRPEKIARVTPPAAGSRPPAPLAVEEEAADALAMVEPGIGEGIGPAETPGTGEGPSGPVDLFPEDILRAWVEKGLPKGEEAEIKAMLERYVATVKAYGDVRAGLVDPYAARVGSAVSDAWEERILPKKERTLGEGVKRWWRALGEKPLRTLRDMVAACATTPLCTPRTDRMEGREPAGTLADIADGWEFGAKRGLVMVGIRADGEVLPLRMLRSTGNPVFDDALIDAVTDAVKKVGRPSARLTSRTGETWMLYEVTAAITVMPPSPAVAGRFSADFKEAEVLYPFKIMVDARTDLRAVFSSGEHYDPTVRPSPRVVDPAGIATDPGGRF